MNQTRERLLVQRLLALFAAGWLLFSFPLLKLWLVDARWLGLPAFPVALFASWALVVAVLAWLMESGSEARPD